MSAMTIDLASNPQLASQLETSRKLARRGLWVLALGLLPLAAFLVLAPLASAVVAPAHVKVDLDRKPVQHAEGGIVREVKVRDGQRVAQGDPLVILGDVRIDAEVNRLTYRVNTERAGIARFEAEQAGLPSLVFPRDLVAAGKADPRVAEQMDKELALFNTRRSSLTSQIALLRTQRDKIGQEMVSLRGQIEQAQASERHQLDELGRNRQLVKDGFIADTRISQLEASLADYRVKLEEKRSDLARAEQRVVDTDLRARSLESDYRRDASEGLKQANARLSEVQQELRKIVDAADRQVVTAPVAGEVMNLRFTSEGAVVGPREPIADIVPTHPRLVVEAQIRPEDINRVSPGQRARMRLTAYNSLTTPMVEGKVFYVSADRLVDRNVANGAPYYEVLIEADPASLKSAGQVTLQAGMPAEVFVDGEKRTPLQYLIEPLTLVMNRAGRER